MAKTEGEYWLGKCRICQMYSVLKDMNLMRLFTYHIIHVNIYLVIFFPQDVPNCQKHCRTNC